MTKAFIQWGHTTKGPFMTQEVPVKFTDTPKCRLSVFGYGETGTMMMIKYNSRWRRVYSRSYGNGASLFVNINGKQEYISTT